MYLFSPNASDIIHRHTGGLEKMLLKAHIGLEIHRHTGGLENSKRGENIKTSIHRHTGGLEID